MAYLQMKVKGMSMISENLETLIEAKQPLEKKTVIVDKWKKRARVTPASDWN